VFVILSVFVTIIPLGHSTHLSKPIITTAIINKNKTISISGWTDYFGPTSDILMYAILKNNIGKVFALDYLISDKKGNFSLQMMLPSYIQNGKYILEIQSHCREEHKSFCFNLSTFIPVDLSNMNNSLKPNNSKSNNFNLTSFFNDKLFDNRQLKKINCSIPTSTIKYNYNNHILFGTNSDDIILGNHGHDVIYGLDGNDIICGNGGNDLIFGGLGNDSITINNNNNTYINGGPGNDLLIASNSNNDTLDGGPGNDLLISYDNGNNILNGSSGINLCYGEKQLFNCYN
jgi:Ca2+-binding RTX toxin-like protein